MKRTAITVVVAVLLPALAAARPRTAFIGSQICVERALVHAAKPDGRHWDGLGRLEPAVAHEVNGVLAKAMGVSAAKLWLTYQGLKFLGFLKPAPDLYAVVRVNGRSVARTPTVMNKYKVAWDNGNCTPPLIIKRSNVVQVSVLDDDHLDQHDLVGSFAWRGIPKPLRRKRVVTIDRRSQPQASQLYALQLSLKRVRAPVFAGRSRQRYAFMRLQTDGRLAQLEKSLAAADVQVRSCYEQTPADGAMPLELQVAGLQILRVKGAAGPLGQCIARVLKGIRFRQMVMNSESVKTGYVFRRLR